MFFLSLSCSLLSETCFISAAISFSSLSKSMATAGRTEAEEKAWSYLIADIIFAPVKHIKCYCESKIYKCVSFYAPHSKWDDCIRECMHLSLSLSCKRQKIVEIQLPVYSYCFLFHIKLLKWQWLCNFILWKSDSMIILIIFHIVFVVVVFTFCSCCFLSYFHFLFCSVLVCIWFGLKIRNNCF